MARLSLFTADMMAIAAEQFNDATAFVQILEQNDLTDFLINQPIITHLSGPAKAGTNSLVIPATSGIGLGWLVFCEGLASYSLVTNVKQNFEIPSGLPFCSCNKHRVLPPAGKLLNTTITIAPNLDFDIATGTPITFSIGVPTTLVLPVKPQSTKRGSL